MHIPRRIHTIWAGGDRLMPDNNMVNVLHWQELYPDFTLYLWVDKKTSPPDLIESYQKRFTELASKHSITTPLKIHIVDIEEEGMSDPYIRYEIDRLRPDYGASSDLIRYHVLHESLNGKGGGIYADSDVGFIQRLPEALFTQDYPEHVVFVDPHAQGGNEVGNDFFMGTFDETEQTPNPIFKAMIDLAHRHYGASSEIRMDNPLFSKPLRSTYASQFPPIKEAHEKNRFEEGAFRYASTPARTGPGMVQFVISAAIGEYKPGDIPQTDRIKSIPDGYLKALREFGLQWTKPEIIRRFKRQEDAVAATIKTIRFEAGWMKMLRLEDHVQDLAHSLHLTVKEATDLLLPKLAFIANQLHPVEYVQFTFVSKAIFDFYRQHHFFEKTCAYPYPKGLGPFAFNMQLSLIWDPPSQIPSAVPSYFLDYLSIILPRLEHYYQMQKIALPSVEWQALASFTENILDFINELIEQYKEIIDKATLQKYQDNLVLLKKYALEYENRVPGLHIFFTPSQKPSSEDKPSFKP